MSSVELRPYPARFATRISTNVPLGSKTGGTVVVNVFSDVAWNGNSTPANGGYFSCCIVELFSYKLNDVNDIPKALTFDGIAKTLNTSISLLLKNGTSSCVVSSPNNVLSLFDQKP